MSTHDDDKSWPLCHIYMPLLEKRQAQSLRRNVTRVKYIIHHYCTLL